MRIAKSAAAGLVCGTMLCAGGLAQEGLFEFPDSRLKAFSKHFDEPFSRLANAWWIEPSTNYSHNVPLYLVHIRGADWTTQAILDEVRTAEDAFSQCELSFEPIMLLEVDVNYALDEMGLAEVDSEQDADWIGRQAIDIEMLSAYAFPRPVLFYRDFGASFSYSKLTIDGFGEAYQPLLGSGYITSHTRDILSDTNTTAHELGHLLFDEFHNADEANLLCADVGGTCGLSTQVTAEQCAKVEYWLDELAPTFSRPMARR